MSTVREKVLALFQEGFGTETRVARRPLADGREVEFRLKGTKVLVTIRDDRDMLDMAQGPGGVVSDDIA